MKIYRHGDLLIKPITKLPKDAKKTKHRILAEGEVTGHYHQFRVDSVDVYEVGNKKYMQVFQPSPLVHEEHRTLTIDPGLYEVNNEREYDYAEEDMKKVVD